MKKNLFVLAIICLAGNIATAQFRQLPQKPKQEFKPMVVNERPKLIGTVIQPVGTAEGNFTNPSSSFTMPDGKRVTVTLRQNPQNLQNNFGGVISERVEKGQPLDYGDMICTPETKTINAQSSTFMNVNYNQQAIHLYPGAVYTYSEFFAGNYRALENGRNPISISTDNLSNSTGATFQDVTDPTSNNIRAAIANITRSFSTTTGSAGIQYRVFTSNNDADFSIKLAAGGGYAGFKASGGFSTSATEKKYYLTIDAIKPLYTLTSSIPTNGFFRDKSIEANNKNLMVIKSITYGTRVLANLEISIQTKNDDVNFKASFGADSGKSVSANAFASFNYLKNSSAASSTANVYVVGGPLNTTIFEKDKLQEQIIDLISKCNYQTAQPLAYSFVDINGNSLGIETATDKFTVNRCVPKGSVQRLVGASITVYTGTDNKEQGSNASFSLVNSNGALVMSNNNNNIEFKSDNNIVLQSQSPNSEGLLQSNFTKNGGFLDIFFDPKPIFLDFDQWKINSAIVTLEFRDQDGATEIKTLNFNNASALLYKNLQRLRLPFNGTFTAGGAFFPN